MLSLLLVLTTFVGVFVAAQDSDGKIDTARARFYGWYGCGPQHYGDINKGWDDAISIATMVKDSIDFSGAAELEYLGPAPYLLPYQDQMKAVFASASTFTRTNFAPFPWIVYVGCTDWKNRCRERGVKVYANNVDYRTGMILQKDDPSSSLRLTFCPQYFASAKLQDKISQGQARRDDDALKWHMGAYSNQGYPFSLLFNLVVNTNSRIFSSQ
jgi:hypothetical protein